MIQVEVKNTEGKTLKTLSLPEEIFGVPVKDNVLHSVIKSYRANRRQGTHATKTKAMVSGGGKKPFKQKGTGEARQGSSRSPLNPGGGVTHGPQPRCYREKINSSIKQLALKMALSDKLTSKRFVVVDDFLVSNYSTKKITAMLKNLQCKNVLLLDERKDHYLYRSSRNIHGVATLNTSELNAEHVLRHEHFVISENGLNVLQQRLGSNQP